MKKIKSLFKRDYDGDGLVYDEVVEGSEWVIEGGGVATTKLDGTSCMIKDGVLYKRYDRKKNKDGIHKDAPDGWIACEDEPDPITGHWPGWLKVDPNKPEDKWHCEADIEGAEDGTYELMGPKIQGNPGGIKEHVLWRHGLFEIIEDPRTFEDIKDFLIRFSMEGIVWHHEDGHMVKIKSRDFGIKWPRQ